MLVGPIFSRELVTAPRRPRFYVARAAYVGVLLVLMSTAWLILAGTQIIRNVSDMARFGGMLFQILAPLQLALALFFSALLAAVGITQEKDRRTLVLLLLTSLTNSELVLGKLLASVLNVLVLLAAALPVFILSMLFGGVSLDQILRAFVVTLATALAAGSIGALVALWREKTFQTLALTVLAIVVWLGIGEAIGQGVFGDRLGRFTADEAAGMVSPWHAVLAAAQPAAHTTGAATTRYVLFAAGLAGMLNLISIVMVRVWNPSRELRLRSAELAERETIWSEAQLDAAPTQTAISDTASATPGRSVHAAPGRTRQVWDNPILWREIRTWAYGRKILLIRVVYLVLFALAAGLLHQLIAAPGGLRLAPAALALVPLFLLSLALVNAQAVTSLTSEREGNAIDLLLVTDLTAKEFVFGKALGVLYNTKEMVLLPIALCAYLWVAGVLTAENVLYLVGALLVLYAFVAMLGIHAGMSYTNARSAIGVSLGTLFFLFVGVATCMRMMIAFSGSFESQLTPFVAFMVGGGVALYAALGARNPSTAIAVACGICPLATFYAITSFYLGNTLAVFLVLAVAYGFATAAMLIPAIFEFDVATGRTTSAEE